MMGPIVTLLLVFLSTTATWAFTRDEVLLYLPFDGSAQPLVAAGGGVPEVNREFSYDPAIEAPNTTDRTSFLWYDIWRG